MNKTTNQLNLIDIYRTPYPTIAEDTIAEDTFFSSSHETFTKVHPKLTYKRNLRNFRRFQSYRMLSD